MAELQASLEQQRCGAEEPVSIRQSPIQWSPLVLGLAVRVLQQPELLPVVEQLRDQMEMQARKIDGLMAMDESPNTVSWQQVQASDPSEAAGSN